MTASRPAWLEPLVGAGVAVGLAAALAASGYLASGQRFAFDFGYQPEPIGWLGLLGIPVAGLVGALRVGALRRLTSHWALVRFVIGFAVMVVLVGDAEVVTVGFLAGSGTGAAQNLGALVAAPWIFLVGLFFIGPLAFCIATPMALVWAILTRAILGPLPPT
jgi:hypothetical protein